MDPRQNPYAPGAGARPPELAGRDSILERSAVALDRIRAGRQAQHGVLIGLRGVGKTVLLNEIRNAAEARGLVTVSIEAPEGRSLPGMLVPVLRNALLRLDRGQAALTLAKRALGTLGKFAKAFKVTFGELEASIAFGEPGIADTGDLETDLAELFTAVGRAAKERSTSVTLFIDELQYVPEEEFAALITALHRSRQDNLPISMIGAGLPQITGMAGKAKSYAERLFLFEKIGPLSPEAAKLALVKPAQAEGAAYTDDALEQILKITGCYPYFLQEWGKHCWEAAVSSPITLSDTAAAAPVAIAALDASFFRVRFDRLTNAEKRYLQAMALIGAGPYSSAQIAEKLGRKPSSFGPVRATLTTKGMIYTPEYGQTAFTVPLFDEFMRREMPLPLLG